MKRIIVETSEDKKNALENALKRQGISLSEWFNDIVEDIVEEPLLYYSNKPNDLTELNAISNSGVTFDLLNNIDWSFSTDETSYLSHNIHPYPAKYIPQIPNQLIRLLSLPGEKIWDPFGGSGTTALESLLLGRQAVSTDINPISQIIGRAKCTTLTNEEEIYISAFAEQMKLLSNSKESYTDLFASNKDEISKVSPNVPHQEKWFQPNVWEELGFLKWKIITVKNETVKNLFLAILSKIVIRVSNQDSETRYVSNIKLIETGVVFKLFAKEIESILPKLNKLGTLLRFRQAQFLTADLRNESKQENNSIDLIVTSPPYPNATDYHLYHRFRIFWLGFDPTDLGKCEIGSHLRHQKENNGIEKYLEEMQMSLINMYNALRPGRYAVLILGDAIFDGEDFKTAELVGEKADKVGFEVVGIFTREVHKTKRSFISAARRLREEKFLLLRKKNKVQKFQLNKPPYKLWPYEEEIRKFEIKNLIGVDKIHEKLGGLTVDVDSMQTDLLKRLTFTHFFESKEYAKEPTWQAIIENGDAKESISKRKDPKYATHGLHEYKGKFYPQLAKSLFNLANLKSGNTILDPFCGSGTVLLEAYLNGFNAIGLDINPIALKIATAKTEIIKLDTYLVDKLLSNYISRVESLLPEINYEDCFDKSALIELESWFPTKVLEKLASITKELNEFSNLQMKGFLEVCLSSIVRDISQQDPEDLRIRRRKEPISDAPVFELYLKKLKEQRIRLRHLSERSNKATSFIGSTKILRCDSRSFPSIELKNISKGSIDCVVTSPPYATALPYIDTDRLSILLLFSMLSKDRKTIEDKLVGAREIQKVERQNLEMRIVNNDFETIGSNTATQIIKEVYDLNLNAVVGFRKSNVASLLFRYYEDMTTIMKNLDWSVKSGGNLFFVIGDTKTFSGNDNKEVVIRSSEALREIGLGIGWTLVKTIPITVTQENRKHNKNSILANDIIWFRKL
jgi:DNA modification methylase